jgi:regulator of protease activity HflC (stomatin/prohibitin superfamily)
LVPVTGGLGDAIRYLLDLALEWWPVRIVREWEQGIRLTSGAIGAEVLTFSNGPTPGLRGLHFFWPKLGEVIVHECNWEVAETTLQTLVTRDGRAVTVGFAVQFRISDLRLFYKSVHDHEATVLEAVRGAAGATVPTMDWEGLSGALAAAMLAATKSSVRGWGLEVKYVVPTTLVDARPIRLIQDAPGRTPVPAYA